MKSPALDLYIAQVRKIDAVPHLADHGGQVVVFTCAERACAEGQAVTGAVDEL